MAATRTSRRPASRRSRSRSRASAGSVASPARIWGRRAFAVVAVVGVGVVAGVVLGLTDKVDNVIRELTLPLRHEDIIRQEARQHGVQPELVAAVIYAESRFRDQTSSAGARGLMQITPATAHHIEKESGGTTFKIEDLSDPDVNIAYGTFRLAELLDIYGGNEVATLAAYNAGETNVARWGGADLEVDDIGFPETRAYVDEVFEKRDEYRRKYARELGY